MIRLKSLDHDNHQDRGSASHGKKWSPRQKFCGMEMEGCYKFSFFGRTPLPLFDPPKKNGGRGQGVAENRVELLFCEDL